MLSAALAATSFAAPGFAQVVCDVLVAPTGSDGASCGPLPTPCRTIQQGIDRAVVEGAGCVQIGAGSYPEMVTLADGVDLFGGYDASWQAGSPTSPGFEARVIGSFDGGTSQYLTVHAQDLDSLTRLRGLTLEGPQAIGSFSGAGRSSTVLLADGARLRLEQMLIQAGGGAPGATGVNGSSASGTPAPSGSNGGNASVVSVLCSTQAGGSGGTAAGSGARRGGAGGTGGAKDTSCVSSSCGIFGGDCSARPGTTGSPATVTQPPAGTGGPSGAPCLLGQDGRDGRVANGPRGFGAANPSGSLVPLSGTVAWVAASGSAGGAGLDGGGGGGGGGSGGCDSGNDSRGAGGGGGGAGGVRALGGGGGGGGGGSFGIVAVDSVLDLFDSTIVRGAGGPGGPGGAGGTGQPGGAGGGGGQAAGGSQPGGDGGEGAHGGHGGGGGGGAGGASFAIYAPSSFVLTSGVSFVGGLGGVGGPGGVSAPGVAPADDDGEDGTPGVNGSVGSVLSLGPPPAPVPLTGPIGISLLVLLLAATVVSRTSGPSSAR